MDSIALACCIEVDWQGIELGEDHAHFCTLERRAVVELTTNIRLCCWQKVSYFSSPDHLHNILNCCTKLAQLLSQLSHSPDSALRAVFSYVSRPVIRRFGRIECVSRCLSFCWIVLWICSMVTKLTPNQQAIDQL